MPNIDLLKRTLAHIEADPENWFQGEWRIVNAEHDPDRCGTSYCFAGWTLQLSGGKWAYPADDIDRNHIVLTPEGEADVAEVAAELLDIDDFYQTLSSHLFDPENTLDDLRRIVGELCAEATPREDSTP